MIDFNTAFDRIIGHEGGYVNNPSDPGGETKWGISKRSYPNLLIHDLTEEDARNIYKRDFWDVVPTTDELRFQLFDFAVNSGIHIAIRYLQRALGVADDGYFGPISQLALTKYSEHELIMKLNAERLEFMTKLNGWNEFGRGWARRIAQNLRYGAQE